MNDATQWVPAPGYEGHYEVSSTGHVRSLNRTVLKSNGVSSQYQSKQLRPAVDQKTGYLKVALAIGGHQKTESVHALVAKAFHGPRPTSGVVRHLDGNKKNNNASNVVWGTYSENGHDTVRHGMHKLHQRTHCLRGHPLSGRNLRSGLPNGYRGCRACKAALGRAKRHPETNVQEYADTWFERNAR